jgi:phospholipase C
VFTQPWGFTLSGTMEPPRITRRSALTAGAGAAATLGLGALPAWARVTTAKGHHRRPGEPPHPNRPIGEPGIPQIETLVLVMLENHSTDNLLGMLPHVSAKRAGRYDGLPVDRHGRAVASQQDRRGRRVHSIHAPDSCPPSSGLTQNWNSSHRQFDRGRNDGFVTNAGSVEPMWYFTPAEVPIIYSLAEHFTVADRYFSSMLGQTLPNRRYWLSATSSGQVNDDNSALLVPAANGTIFDRLDAGKVDWRVYYDQHSLATPFYFPNFRNNPRQVIKCVGQSQFFTDAAAGKLPPVCYVEANGKYQSEENPQDIAYGETFLHNVAQACMNSPQWSKMAMIVNYDEHGGYYDHVVPPRAVTPDDVPPDLTLSAKGTSPAKFDRLGFRVPLIVVSPWGQPTYVSHRTMDHTSVLAFIEHKWNLPPLTRRDAAAWDMRDLFDVSKRRLGAIHLPAPPSITATAAKCRADGNSPPGPSPHPLPAP